MKSWQSAVLAALISAVVALGVTAPWARRETSAPVQPEAFSRIVSAKTIRCGYVIAPPYTIRDPNTGKLGGLSFETMETVAKQAGYKLIWAEEVGWATMIQGLQTGRYDMICSGVWVNSAR